MQKYINILFIFVVAFSCDYFPNEAFSHKEPKLLVLKSALMAYF